jgi:hypothetical protein
MIELNVPCIQEPKEIFGARVAQYVDPDGLAISVGEERRGNYRSLRIGLRYFGSRAPTQSVAREAPESILASAATT